ncbi:GNAT family N-acetyltransferase [Prauserella sp. PE36]|uniref:GNAT family N-acetyltransferase n=1 Tax=Prauserella sp. PE36 TaxID=1504709 RepID=UPI000DE46E94|nr:GNAT family N-acetyltransferase [Prauserella sp. PE36]RBM23142.1 GNAT family N-acetyltransferase [Prauserella sp. PE36]
MLAEHFPLVGLRLTTPRLGLRLPSQEELAELGELAAKGVHDPSVMPFVVPWTDQTPEAVARSVIQYHWLRLGDWLPQSWSLNLVVFRDGVPVGQQTINGHDFGVTREVSTGSWLGKAHQGKGIGTEMRAAVLHLAFAGLGAAEAASGAFEHNLSSLTVSRKLGYRPDGRKRHTIRGKLSVEHRMRLSRTDWELHRRVPVSVEGLEPCLPLLGITAAQTP